MAAPYNPVGSGRNARKSEPLYVPRMTPAFPQLVGPAEQPRRELASSVVAWDKPRDPGRITPTLQEAEAYWRQDPDLRLGQLINAAAGVREREVPFIEEAELVEGIRDLRRRISGTWTRLGRAVPSAMSSTTTACPPRRRSRSSNPRHHLRIGRLRKDARSISGQVVPQRTRTGKDARPRAVASRVSD